MGCEKESKFELIHYCYIAAILRQYCCNVTTTVCAVWVEKKSKFELIDQSDLILEWRGGSQYFPIYDPFQATITNSSLASFLRRQVLMVLMTTLRKLACRQQPITSCSIALMHI